MASKIADGTSKNAAQELPPFLTDSWNYSHYASEEIDKQLKGLTTSALREIFINSQIERYNATQKRQQTVSSLSSVVIDSISKAFNTSVNPSQDAKTIIESLNENTLDRLLISSSLSFKALRILFNSAPLNIVKRWQNDMDIDERVLAQERHVRQREELKQHDMYLIKLKDLPIIIPGSRLSDDGDQLHIRRRPVPKGGLEVLDHWRNHEGINILATDSVYRETFERITKSALSGLDWNNVIVAGE